MRNCFMKIFKTNLFLFALFAGIFLSSQAVFAAEEETTTTHTGKELTVTAEDIAGSPTNDSGQEVDYVIDDTYTSAEINTILAYAASDSAYTASNPMVVYVKAGTYNMTKLLKIYSNTYIWMNNNAKFVRGATRRHIMTNYRSGSVGGYDATANITINGGIFDGNLENRAVNTNKDTLLAFIHCSNVTVKNATLQNCYNGHLLAFEGAKDCVATKCTFTGYKAYGENTNEAIQLDITHDSTTQGSEDVVYDDTACQNIAITNNTFSNYSVGVGAHFLVNGIYSKNITITGNTFTGLEHEAVKAKNFVGLTISNNSISNCGESIRVFNRADASSTYAPDAYALSGVATESAPEDYQIVITNNNINNITDTNDMGAAIRVLGSTAMPIKGVTVMNNTINTTVYYGVQLSYVENANVSSNNISSTKKASIYAINSKNITADSNTVTGNSSYSSVNGVAFSKITNASISNTTILNMTGSAITTSSSSAVSIANNTIGTPKNYGIYVTATPSVTVSGNYIQGAGSDGIYVSGSAGANIVSNTVKDSVKTGIELASSANSYIQTNKVSGSTGTAYGYGIIVKSSSNNTSVYKNTSSQNAKDGICIMDSSSVLVQKNTAKKNSGAGMTASYAPSIRILGNTFGKSGANGVYVTNCESALLKNNIVQNGQAAGIYMVSSKTATLQKNTVKKNKNNGIYLGSCKKAVIKGNKMNGNKGYGLSLRKCKKPTVKTTNSYSKNKKGRIRVA